MFQKTATAIVAVLPLMLFVGTGKAAGGDLTAGEGDGLRETVLQTFCGDPYIKDIALPDGMNGLAASECFNGIGPAENTERFIGDGRQLSGVGFWFVFATQPPAQPSFIIRIYLTEANGCPAGNPLFVAVCDVVRIGPGSGTNSDPIEYFCDFSDNGYDDFFKEAGVEYSISVTNNNCPGEGDGAFWASSTADGVYGCLIAPDHGYPDWIPVDQGGWPWDNAMYLCNEPSECMVFYDQAEFENYMLQSGKFLKGVETFEESNVQPNQFAFLRAPLDRNPNVDGNGFGFPDGLEQTNVEIWDNTTPGPNPPELNPSGDPTAMAVVGPDFNSSNSVKVTISSCGAGPSYSIDMVFTEPNHTGIGFQLGYMEPSAGEGWHISVFDTDNVEILKAQVPPAPNEPSKTFFGVWCERDIGRINVFDKSGAGGASCMLIDDIQMWREFLGYPYIVEIPPGQDPADPDDGVVTVPCDSLIRYDDLEDDWPLVGYSVGGPAGQEPQLLSIVGTTPADADSYLIQSAGFWAEFWIRPGLVPVFVREEADTTNQTVELVNVTSGGKWEVTFTNPICVGPNSDFSVVLCVAEGVWGVTGEDTDGTDNRSYWSVGTDCAPRNPLPDVDLMIWACVTPCGPPPMCMPFYSQAEFEDYMLQSGKLLKGVETFEESNIEPGGKQPLPAPLDENPNVGENGIGFPDGLEQANLIIQDNIYPGPNPPEPMPSGDPIALYVIGEGFGQSNSKKVGEDLFLLDIWASLDLIFTGPTHTGVGFELTRFPGGNPAPWHISVYNTFDQEIGKFLVDPTGEEPFKTFFGIWCEEDIGRINIWDEAGPEPDAVDNIQMWREIPPECQPFFSEGEFEEFMLSQDKYLKGVETFEESNLPVGFGVALPAPLDENPNVDPGTGWGFPEGLEQTNLVIWDNMSPEPSPPDLNPSGRQDAIWAFAQEWQGSNSTKVGINYFDTPSMDLVFTEPNHTGVGFNLSYPVGFEGQGWHISVFSKNGEEIGNFQIPGPPDQEPFKSFFGIWCPETMGRINIFDKSGTGDSVDNIQMWRTISSGVGDEDRPLTVVLYQNVPNPFNPRTVLRFSIPRALRVDLSIYDVSGRRVNTLVDGLLEPGLHTVPWDGRDESGARVTSGVFLSRLTAGDFSTSRKMLLLK